MTNHPHNPEIDHPVNQTAVSIYGQDDAMDDFPVLKAFQQYVDSEQSKARKRLISLGIFFGVLMGAVIAVFLVMLFNITERNQSLNDRLVEFAMKERSRTDASVVVQPPVQQDNSAILQLTSKIESLQNKLAECQKRAEEAERAQKAAAEAAAAALAPKAPSPLELEISKLKALLKAEKEKAAIDKAKLKEAELEAWRRKQYPDCYAQPQQIQPAKPKQTGWSHSSASVQERHAAVAPVSKAKVKAADAETVLTGKAIRYFDDDEEDAEEEPIKPVTRKVRDVPPVPVAGTKTNVESSKSENEQVAAQVTNSAPSQIVKPETPNYEIPVEVRGKQSSWRLPD